MLGKIAGRIARTYREAFWIRLSRWSRRSLGEAFIPASNDGEHFEKAAAICAAEEAPPVPFVVAQFEAFDVASGISGRVILPRPCHLSSERATSRWRAKCAGTRRIEDEASFLLRTKRTSRGSDADFYCPDQIHPEHFRDERKMANLAVLLKVSEEEVLRRLPDEFSPSFLRTMGVA